MYIETLPRLSGKKLNMWESFIKSANLEPDHLIEKTVLVWDDDEIAASGSRYGNILKLIAVNPKYRGEDLTSTVIGALRQDAFSDGHRSLFLYTKPENEKIFSSIFFYPVAKTDKVLLLEDKKDGIKSFIEGLPKKDAGGKVGAVIMNCNPFTLGHKYLIETAAGECDLLYVFVLSEDKSYFSFEDRFEMVKLGVAHLGNVCVLPTGPYLISSATFPTYFLKDRDSVSDAQCLLDIEIFIKHFVKSFKITHRYVGTEPTSLLTDKYNEALKKHLPRSGVILKEIERIKSGDAPISASTVRELIKQDNISALRKLLPQTTLDYLSEKKYIRG